MVLHNERELESQLGRLNDALQPLFRERRYFEATELVRTECSRFVERGLLEERDLISQYLQFSLLLRKRWQYAQAHRLLGEAISIARRTRGAEPSLAKLLFQSAEALFKMERLSEAEAAAKEAFAVESALTSTESVNPSLSGLLGALAQKNGDLAGARLHYQASVQAFGTHLGDSSPRLLTALGNLAAAYEMTGEYEKANSILTEVKAKRIKLLNQEFEDSGDHWNNAFALAVLLEKEGDRRGSLDLFYQLARTSRDSPLDKARAWERIAAIEQADCNYERAEDASKHGLECLSLAVHEEHPSALALRRNLIALQLELGDCQGAAEALAWLRQRTEAILGTSHPDWRAALRLLGRAHLQAGKIPEARSAFQKILDSYGKAEAATVSERIADNLNVAYAASLLGDSFAAQHCVDAASRLAGDAPAVSPGAFLYVEVCKTRLAAQTGGIADALHHSRLALARLSEAEIPPGLFATEALLDGALLEALSGNPENACRLLKKAFDLIEYMNAGIFGFGSERQLLAFNLRVPTLVSATLSCGFCFGGKLTREFYALVERALRLKDGAFDVVRRRRLNARLTHGSDEAAALLHDLNAVRRGLAQQSLEESARSKGAGDDRFRRLAQQREEVERRLAKLVDGSERRLGDNEWSLRSLISGMPCNAAFLDCISYTRSWGSDGATRGIETREALAYVLVRREGVRLVALETKSTACLSAEITGAYQILTDRLRASASKSSASTQASDGSLASLRKLYELLILPLEKFLDGVETLYVRPDGPLHFLPLEALIDSQGRHLIERWQVVYIAGAPEARHASALSNRDVAIFADPDFDAKDAGAPHGGPGPSGKAPLREAARRESRKGGWSRIGGTLIEAATVERSLRGKPGFSPLPIHSGREASETNLLSTYRPRILHIATHGFWFGYHFIYRELGTSKPFAGMANVEQVISRSADPLTLSGIALAGANRLFADGSAAGWVTLEQIAGLDLCGTELVFLSACDAGLGYMQPFQGVYGIRRAFHEAGAMNVIMSLWRVDDEAAVDFAREFYVCYRDEPLPGNALRAAKLAMLKSSNGKYADPFYWAGFIGSCLGLPLEQAST